MSAMTLEQLARHKKWLETVSDAVLDERLETLMCHCYSTIQIQNQ